MHAYLLSIGDELASGLITNTNSAWLAQHLTHLGIRVVSHLTVGDDLPRIVSAIRNALSILQQDEGCLQVVVEGHHARAVHAELARGRLALEVDEVVDIIGQACRGQPEQS